MLFYQNIIPQIQQDNMNTDNIYHNYFNEMSCFVSVKDRDLRIIDSNRYFKEHFGVTEGEYCYEVYKGRMNKCDDCPVEKTFITGKPQEHDELISNLKGEDIPIHVITSPIFDENGEVKCVVEISSDVSKVKRIQKKLYETQKQLYQFFDAVPCYISIQDRDLKLINVNKRFREDFGMGGGSYCYEVYKHRDEPCIECSVAKTFEDGQSHQSEEVVTAISGDQYNVLVSTAPIRDSQGVITHVIEMSTNITEIRQLQDQLTSLGLLVGSISHDIKGLSSSLDGGIYLMDSGLKKNDKERINRGWDVVNRNVSQMRRMISDILYYAKDRELFYETIDIPEFVKDIVTTMENKANSFKVNFKYEYSTSLGEFAIDVSALRSALVNVLENSFDACRKDLNKESHFVTLKVLEDDNKKNIIFDITDNGIGMDQETQDKIFSLFFSSKGIEGTGLGLFISNKIIKKHGGTIEVSSAISDGAHFRITLPRNPDSEENQ
jgi:PAS domain S-box-containing protein